MRRILGRPFGAVLSFLTLAGISAGIHANHATGAWLSPASNNWPLIPIHDVFNPDGRALS